MLLAEIEKNKNMTVGDDNNEFERIIGKNGCVIMNENGTLASGRRHKQQS